MNKRQTGSRWERVASDYLREQGLGILETNFRNRSGEIDIIARDKEYLVFVEVKYRSEDICGNAWEAVTYAKQKQICKVADFYRLLHGYNNDTAVRYDVIAIDEGEIRWLQNAFPHRYRN